MIGGYIKGVDSALIKAWMDVDPGPALTIGIDVHVRMWRCEGQGEVIP